MYICGCMKITPSKRNTNRHTEKGMQLLEKSINEVGVIESISVTKEGTIISGHARKATFDKQGKKPKEVHLSDNEYPVIVRADIEDNTDLYYKAQILANTTSKQNIDLDTELIEEIAVEYDLDIEELGVEIEEDTETHLEAEEDDFDPTPPEVPITVLGDLYEIGGHRLLCGDSTDSDQVAKLMNGQKADIAFTSPPYNAGKSESLSGNTHTTDNKYNEYNDNQKQSDYLGLLIGFTNNALINAEYLICNIQSLAGNKIALIDYLYQYKNNFIDVAIWDKGHGAPAMAENVMTSAWEYMFFISSKENATRAIPNAGFRGTVPNIYRGKPQRNNEFSNVHAATFPIDLPEWALQFTTPGNIILDQFLGTGTTMVASHQLKRKCYGMELDPKYCDVIVRRMLKLDPTLAIKRNGVLTNEFNETK